MIQRSAAGVPGAAVAIGGGLSRMIAVNVSAAEALFQARWPVIIS